MEKQVSVVLLSFRLNDSLFLSEGRETRSFSFHDLQIVFYGSEISWPVPFHTLDCVGRYQEEAEVLPLLQSFCRIYAHRILDKF